MLGLICGALLIAFAAVFSQRLFTASRWYHKLHNPHSYPLPPSPPSQFFFGHTRVIPTRNPEKYYKKLSKKYNSDVLYFKQYRTPVIVLNSVKAANELLSKQGANYSSRPRFVLFEVMGWGLTLTFMPWSPLFKTHRALLQKSFTKSNIIQYQALQERSARRAILRIINSPSDWSSHLRSFASTIVQQIAFGVELSHDEDARVQRATSLANRVLAEGGSPGSTLIDNFPFLAKLPIWLVRSKALEHARNLGWIIRDLHDIPFAASRREFEAGTLRDDCFVSPLLEQFAEEKKQDKEGELSIPDINGAAATIFIAGFDTTYTTLLVGILAFLSHPPVFHKAREILERVIGTARLPSLSDRENPELRYLDYIVDEISRWRPLSPLGVPHKSVEDDVYDGMFIPKGATVYFNAWAMSRDEATYREPERFCPERYLEKGEGGWGEPVLQAPFGFGRRVCPGKYLAQASVWIALVTLIVTVDISNLVGGDGEEIKPEVEFSSGLSR
ncbi:cytochrome P450 [Hyaloscypha variabilis F]|uniref:Cytochrome P450 n=1 Tax=Hyaloscypha variabilis (strain UAMH 11265 / GT02V1 / F) TaxID=1149755 RepID=A0A2J6R7C7_HYAVF|nr:cytochrome P450 [Hyaloscypha variabilis F]